MTGQAGAYSGKEPSRGDRLTVAGFARLITDMGAVSGLSLEERIVAAETHLGSLRQVKRQRARQQQLDAAAKILRNRSAR